MREKIGLLGGFSEMLIKFNILKIKFLHEKIILFDLDFFSDKVWLCSVQKWALQWAYLKNWQNGSAIFQFSDIFACFLIFSKKTQNYSKTGKMTGPFCQFLGDAHCRPHFWTLHIHTLPGKKSRPKNIIFSWNNSIFKMWNLNRIPYNLPSSDTFSRRASYIKTGGTR